MLDLLAKRAPRFQQSAAIFSRIQAGEYYGTTSVLVFANVFYILRKIKGQKAAREALQKLKKSDQGNDHFGGQPGNRPALHVHRL